MPRSAAAQRVLDASLALFAERGYALTTMADIESASGLTPGAGGVYRHFASKFEILEAGVRDHLDALDAAQAVTFDDQQLDLVDVLTLHVRGGLVMIRGQRTLIRLLYRDLNAFPDLLEEVKRRLVYVGTIEFATRLRHVAKAYTLDRSLDFEAIATIFAGAVTNVGVIEATLDERPPIDEERFVATWVDVLATHLTRDRVR